ncbi:hypothetical protein KFU94_33665 [Chloroflexi bacterium TSY]|nr:hypothetical protein [Chloroflexi bacterium TSY]
MSYLTMKFQARFILTRVVFKFVPIIISITAIMWLIVLDDQLRGERESLYAASKLVDIEGWSTTAALPKTVASRNAVVIGDQIFLIGGRDTDGQPINHVYRAKIATDGSIFAWQETTPLPDR